MTPPRKDRLGRGLGALLGDYSTAEKAPAGDVRSVVISSIFPNPLQPRREFSEAELAELTSSIGENGLLQPLLVRPAGPGRYELVAGERRLRSVQRLGWQEVPVVVRKVEDESLLVLALVENLQREELNPLEEAEGYRTLTERFGLTQEEVSRAVGKDRSTVANLLRLLKLPPSLRRLLEAGELSVGHARALLSWRIRCAPRTWPARRSRRDGLFVRSNDAHVGPLPGRHPGRLTPGLRVIPWYEPSRKPCGNGWPPGSRSAPARREWG